MTENYHPIIKKIVDANKDTYVIFFTRECPYCIKSLNLLRESKVKYKGYDINSIKGGMNRILEMFNKNANIIGFNKKHITKPIIFYNGKFIGGYTELSNILGKN